MHMQRYAVLWAFLSVLLVLTCAVAGGCASSGAPAEEPPQGKTQVDAPAREAQVAAGGTADTAKGDTVSFDAQSGVLDLIRTMGRDAMQSQSVCTRLVEDATLVLVDGAFSDVERLALIDPATVEAVTVYKEAALRKMSVPSCVQSLVSIELKPERDVPQNGGD